MKIRFFASLKDYFGEELTLKDISFQSVEELSVYLKDLKPESSNLLEKCRYAVNNSFVNSEVSLSNIEEVLVMPPSSGG